MPVNIFQLFVASDFDLSDRETLMTILTKVKKMEKDLNGLKAKLVRNFRLIYQTIIIRVVGAIFYQNIFLKKKIWKKIINFQSIHTE